MNARGLQERAFTVRVAAPIWTTVACFLVALALVPQPFNVLIWVPYSVGVSLAIRAMNRRQQELCRADEAERM